eukprot:m.235494 g.235494  ORF g.235494 m.235494 type:complete len:315 (-) comp33664_c11_seq2:262-1206(-)
MAHIRPLAGSELFGSLLIDNQNNAGYLEYDSDDDRGCRPESSDEEDDEHMPDDPRSKDDVKPELLLDGIESELDAKMRALQQTVRLESATDVPGNSEQEKEKEKEPTAASGTNAPDSFYDETYFDSDEDMDEATAPPTKKGKKGKRKMVSNDDLLYDPSIDEDNQRWVENFRRKQYEPFNNDSNLGVEEDEEAQAAVAESNKKRGLKALPTSDALLNCAACMCVLSLDCQRHEKYENQFRAMFVHNCKVEATENLYFRENTRKFKTKQARENDTQINADDQAFHPVKCTECDAVVGVYDVDEVYHFFNVLASPV